jgi:cytochrome c oxidase subunit 4
MKEASARTLLLTYLALMALLGLTAWASYWHPTWLANTASLTIACAKAWLILLYFMHLRYRSLRLRLAASLGLIWLFFLFFITLGDYFTRGMLGILGK